MNIFSISGMELTKQNEYFWFKIEEQLELNVPNHIKNILQ